jgi:hypothetical protein
VDEPIPSAEPLEPVERRTPATNRPFGHAMTVRAHEVTVPVRDVTPAPQAPRRIPVQSGDPAAAIDLPIASDDEAVA